jgi:hypothetical protein
MADVSGRPASQATRHSAEPEPCGLGPSGECQAQRRKLKGFTKQQSDALLWCGEEWRRIRDGRTGPFQSKGLRPYIEYDFKDFGVGARIRVRLRPAGVELLRERGITSFPHYKIPPWSSKGDG